MPDIASNGEEEKPAIETAKKGIPGSKIDTLHKEKGLPPFFNLKPTVTVVPEYFCFP
jgi:hypothetical protein